MLISRHAHCVFVMHSVISAAKEKHARVRMNLTSQLPTGIGLDAKYVCSGSHTSSRVGTELREIKVKKPY